MIGWYVRMWRKVWIRLGAYQVLQEAEERLARGWVIKEIDAEGGVIVYVKKYVTKEDMVEALEACQ